MNELLTGEAPQLLQANFRSRLLPANFESSIFVPEEHLRRWLPMEYRLFSGRTPLGANGALRIMDQYSQTKLHGKRIVAATYRRLDTEATRFTALNRHANHSDWNERSPLISADANPYSTISRARRYRQNGRGSSYVSLINKRVRLRSGYPTLSAYEEMLHYEVEDPYNRDYAYYHSQILYPYAIFEDEVVGIWPWSQVETMIAQQGTEGWVQFLRDELDEHEQRAAHKWHAQNPIFAF